MWKIQQQRLVQITQTIIAPKYVQDEKMESERARNKTNDWRKWQKKVNIVRYGECAGREKKAIPKIATKSPGEGERERKRIKKKNDKPNSLKSQ